VQGDPRCIVTVYLSRLELRRHPHIAPAMVAGLQLTSDQLKSLAAPPSRRLGRAGLEALPLRARFFLSFSHPENAKIPSKSVPHMLSQGSAECPDLETSYKLWVLWGALGTIKP
jgi:hypothetical protein